MFFLAPIVVPAVEAVLALEAPQMFAAGAAVAVALFRRD